MLNDDVTNILVLAGDPGGAEAVAPVIAELSRMVSHRVVLRSYRQATQVFLKHRLHPSELVESFSVPDFCNLLTAEQIALVLSATSVNGVDLEKRLFRAAEQAAVPVLAVIDFWSNYNARFTDANGSVCLPSLIAVPNKRAKQDMINEGFACETIRVTGQPAFDRLRLIDNEVVKKTREAVREQLEILPHNILVVFVSQPLVELYGGEDECLLNLGYSEQTVITSLKAAIGLLRRKGTQVKLVIQGHPREMPDKWKREAKGGDVLVNPLNQSTLDICMAAEVVVGMTSVVLHEASLLGLNVLSLTSDSSHMFTGCDGIRELSGASPIEIAEAISAKWPSQPPISISSTELASSLVMRELVGLSPKGRCIGANRR